MLFESAKLKVKRAENHIIDVNNVIDRLNGDYYNIVPRFNSQADAYVFWIKNNGNPVTDLGLLVGDAAHNLRSALDHLMRELVVLCGGKSTREISFPIYETQNKLETVIQNGQIKSVGVDIVDHIVNVIKPYKGGNDSLFSLSILDNVDKHDSLVVISPYAIISGDTHQSSVTRSYNLGTASMPTGIIIDPATPKQINPNVIFSLRVSFGQGQPFENEQVIPTLHRLSQLVTGIIADIEGIYNSRN